MFQSLFHLLIGFWESIILILKIETLKIYIKKKSYRNCIEVIQITCVLFQTFITFWWMWAVRRLGTSVWTKGTWQGGEADEFIVVRFEVEYLQGVHSSGDAQYAVVTLWTPGGGHI